MINDEQNYGVSQIYLLLLLFFLCPTKLKVIQSVSRSLFSLSISTSIFLSLHLSVSLSTSLSSSLLLALSLSVFTFISLSLPLSLSLHLCVYLLLLLLAPPLPASLPVDCGISGRLAFRWILGAVLTQTTDGVWCMCFYQRVRNVAAVQPERLWLGLSSRAPWLSTGVRPLSGACWLWHLRCYSDPFRK